MMRRRMPIKAISQIRLDPQPQGGRAVFLVEALDDTQAQEVSGLFAELEPEIQVRQLSRGKLVSYAVKTGADQQEALTELEQALKTTFGFVALHRSFDEVIYRVISELCADTGSELVPIPRCDICGKIEPFPDTIISLSNYGGETVASGEYCGACTAVSAAASNKEFLLSLLNADTRDFSALQEMQFIRAKSRTQEIRFSVRGPGAHVSG